MKVLATNSRSDYFYVKDLEQASTAYAETIYNGIYQYIKNVKITVDDDTALIYNFDKNAWSWSLDLDSISSGATKNYHITVAKYNPDINIMVEYELSGKKYKVNSKIKRESNGKIDMEAYKFLWRQETLELLYDIETYVKNPDNTSNAFIRPVRCARRDFDAWTDYGMFPEIVESDCDDDNDDVSSVLAPLAPFPENKEVLAPETIVASETIVATETIVSPEKIKAFEETQTDEQEVKEETSNNPTQRKQRRNSCCFNIFSIGNDDYYDDYYDKQEEEESVVVEDNEIERLSAMKEPAVEQVVENKEEVSNAPDDTSNANEDNEDKQEIESTELEKLNKRIDRYFKEVNKFIEKYDLSKDDFMKQLLSVIKSSQKSLFENNNKRSSDIHSRCLTLGRQRSHSINDDDSVNQSTSCFRNATLDNIISRVSSDKP
jgi:hypothetical protein